MNRILVTLLLVSSIQHMNAQKHKSANANRTKKENLSCHLCLLQDEIDQTSFAIVAESISGASEKTLDSLRLIESLLKEQLKKDVEKYSTKYNYHTSILAIDSAIAICIRSYAFGATLNEDERKMHFKYLYDEILNFKSNHSIDEPDKIRAIKPINTENGVISINHYGKKYITENLDTWKQERLIEWNIWMDKIDLIVIKLTTKTFNELDNLERLVLYLQMKTYSDIPE